MDVMAGRKIRDSRRPRAVALALGFWVLMVLPAGVKASEWTSQEFAKFRLLAGAGAIGTSDKVLAALEVKLAPGWQFYHAEPGQYGVAPKFVWTRSQNLERAALHWPAPIRYTYSVTPPIATMGYKDDLLLPMTLSVADPARPLEVRLDLEYAVCESYCIVDKVSLALRLPPGPPAPTEHSRRLAAARKSAEATAGVK